MTSDDTKVDTSAPATPVEEWVMLTDQNEEATTIWCKDIPGFACYIARFRLPGDARYALHAAQSLPKMTAERDELAADLERFKNMYCNAFSDRSLLRLERDALSARVKELGEALREMIRLLDYSEDEVGHMADFAKNEREKARALIGKEPSK